eukprot:4932379-Amphidinium_carterae.1
MAPVWVVLVGLVQKCHKSHGRMLSIACVCEALVLANMALNIFAFMSSALVSKLRAHCRKSSATWP